ncbi:hypothetical protein [[Limnothrix rosea] IAM M-220]|uniref:hypothetical protein n=1 Tax=[Limnothrix rosea] IAM M-220 TaxID=454133 RepID=UPI000962ECF2|nr:hypothetical protein [[Limnothrix rosea] IAM M-220]OKH15230.1 hypothetical protein NIES208_12725 [[Limnothrix rosea] IAM M-220]
MAIAHPDLQETEAQTRTQTQDISKGSPISETGHIDELRAEIQGLRAANQQLASDNQELQEKLEKSEKELQQFMLDFDLDSERKKLQAQNNILRSEQADTQRVIEHLKQEKNQIAEQSKLLQFQLKTLTEDITAQGQFHQVVRTTDLILKSSEIDYYDHEKHDLVLEILEEQVHKTIEGSRRYDLLVDLLKHNQKVDHKSDLLSELENIFKGIKSFSSQDKKQLTKIGFLVSDKGKHIKAIFHGDRRYQISFAKSCSDTRGGLNIIGEIRRKVF